MVFFDVDLDVFPVRLGRLGRGLVYFSASPENFRRGDAASDTGDEKDPRHQIGEKLG